MNLINVLVPINGVSNPRPQSQTLSSIHQATVTSSRKLHYIPQQRQHLNSNLFTEKVSRS